MNLRLFLEFLLKELFAYGASNLFSSFFSCFPSAASLSRSSVQDASGGKTQVNHYLFSKIRILILNIPLACLIV